MAIAKGLRKFTDIFLKVFGVLATIAMIIMTIVILFQVIIRFSPINNIAWTEELSRFAFIWSSMLGAAIAYDRGSFASITMVPNALKGKAKWIFYFVVEIVVLLVAFIIIRYGFQLAIASSFMKTTALHAPMWIQYVPVPVGGIGIALSCIVHIVGMLTTGKLPKESDAQLREAIGEKEEEEGVEVSC